tara:strand:+ start:731 stop:904 length:174 start_codon:yes stop_codon:yes gene_type:complete
MSKLKNTDGQEPKLINIMPSISNYEKIIDNYQKGISSGEFYEEPIVSEIEQFFYPDW